MSENPIKQTASQIKRNLKKDVPWQVRLIGLIVPKTTGSHNKILSKLFMGVMKKGDMYYYVPKDKAIKIDHSLKHQESLLPSKLVHHFIDKANYHTVMRYCFCRTKMNCQNHSREIGCLILGEAAVGSSSELVKHITREEAHRYVENARADGLVHMIGRTFGDTAVLRMGRQPGKYHSKCMVICNCCNCCCLARILPYSVQGMKDLIIRMPGVGITVRDTCVGCQTCVKACMFDGIRFENGKAYQTDDCVACGRCADVCPEKAIEISISEQTITAAADHLSTLVDVT